jgi:hypothetical protein
MIDREARTKLAELIRHLVAGLITNDEFDDRRPISTDAAIWEVFHWGAWHLYSDLGEYRLIGKYRLPKEGRREVSRWILFLKTDLEYEWPQFSGLQHFIYFVSSILSFGLLRFALRRYWSRLGDLTVWPFLRRSDYEAALKRPPYFSGAL